MTSGNPITNGTGASTTPSVTNDAEEETQMNLDATTWDQIMTKYWTSTTANREREDAELREAFAREESELADRQLKLSQERVKLLEQLKAVDQQWMEIEAQRKAKEEDTKRRYEAIREERERDDELKRRWFEENRRKAASGEQGQDPADLAMLAKKARGVVAVVGGEPRGEDGSTSGLPSQRETPLREEQQRHALPSRPREGGRTPSEEQDRAQELQQQLRNEQQQQKERMENGLDGKVVDIDKLPKVYNGAGICVGHVRPINLRNHLTMHVQQQPIKRHVQIRQGRNFTAETLETIYEPSDKKGAKWLSCWIQATGDVQETPCASCTTRQGVFPQCIILDAEGFPRCGNCEWNRQGCSGASKHADHEMAEVNQKVGDGEVVQEAPVVTSGFKAVNGTSTSQKTAKVVSSVPNGDEQPARSKLPSGRKSLPSTRKSSVQPDSIAPTPLEGSPAPNDSDHTEDLPPINQAVLALRDDGVVFTDPPCMRGVPLARIGPDHPYWDPEWVALEEPVQAQLAKWSEKYEKLKNEGGAASTKYLAGRQQNRGKLVLEFLANGEFHPYQLMAKHLINKAYTGYDNLYRMVQVLEELKRFKQLDVSPSQWLRHRLHEIYEELGDKFNLGKAVENLYSDPKLRQLRSESGFGNIGRPRGYKPTMADKGEDGPAPKKTNKGTKRKAAAPAADDPANQSFAEEQLRVVDHQADGTAPSKPPSSHSSPSAPEELGHPHAHPQPPAAKHHQPSPSVTLKILAPPEDLYYEGYTSDDSYSGDKIQEVDWRLLQVRHREMTTNTGITQYWHWLGAGEDLTGRGEENCFEHQVLKDVKGRRVTWGVYKEPIDFHLRLEEIEEVVYAPEGSGCLKILISVKKDAHGDEESRGDVLAWFKRERTKRRFLSFLVKKGKRVVRSSAAYVEQAWDDMDSVVLPHEDE
ncbi:hypothetical protein B0H65DRAFT_512859 [Neurospora tetraspora]|uniref:Uncharacterized protein n=1 Tax=Neurospora tetraspora TaxID=94610 RepID=A0AAE0IZR4_9PEZI|nr:hypothetical protein B0H65DRAFT_512859 [Neurospora tetraspora]